MSAVFSFAGILAGGGDEPAGRREAPPAGESPLPCLYSHNSTEVRAEWNVLQGSHKQTAYVLVTEIQGLAKEFGIERLGFLTLTFGDHVTKIREAQRRFNSLNTHVLKKRFERAIAVWERQKSSRIHFHLVVVLASDIRTGFDFAGIERGDYRSANSAIRSEWAFWRQTAPKYGFGRTELLPVKSTADGIARYVGKYVSKCIGARSEEDKGARVVRYIGFKPGTRRACTDFAWNSEGGWLWRHKLKAFCAQRGYADTDALKKAFGPRWAYKLQASIMETVLPEETVYPSEHAAQRAAVASAVAEVRGVGLAVARSLSATLPKKPVRGEVSDNDEKRCDGLRRDGRRARFDRVKIYDTELEKMVYVLVPASMDREPF